MGPTPNPILPEAARVTRAGPPGRWEIAIDGWRPAALNELVNCHWRKRDRLKKLDRDHVILFAGRARVPLPKNLRRISLRIVLPPKQRRWDIDAFQKSCLDACKHAGLIKDDNPKWARWGGVEYPKQRGPLSTTIVVEDVDGEGGGS